MNPSQLCLNDDLSLVLCDLSGAETDEAGSAEFESSTCDIPQDMVYPDSVQPNTFRFSFASMFFHIITEQDPDITPCYATDDGPAFFEQDKVHGRIVWKCWCGEYDDYTTLQMDFREIMQSQGMMVTDDGKFTVDEIFGKLIAAIEAI